MGICSMTHPHANAKATLKNEPKIYNGPVKLTGLRRFVLRELNTFDASQKSYPNSNESANYNILETKRAAVSRKVIEDRLEEVMSSSDCPKKSDLTKFYETIKDFKKKLLMHEEISLMTVKESERATLEGLEMNQTLRDMLIDYFGKLRENIL